MLGLSSVTKMYQLIFTDLDIHFCLGAWENKKLIGFAVVSKNMDVTHTLFHKLFSFTTYLSLFFYVVTFKISLMRIFKRFFFERKLPKVIGKNYCCMGPICVSKKYQKHGIGRLLITGIVKYIRKSKINTLYVYTRFDNKNAVAFYNKIGFENVGIFYDGIVLKYQIGK